MWWVVTFTEGVVMFVRFAAVTVGIDGEDGNEGELPLELLAAHRPRVLELSQPLIGESVEVGHTLAQGTLPPVCFSVLDALLQLDEVCFAIVELIAVEVMDVTLGVTLAVPDLVHSDVAGDAAGTGVANEIP